MKSKILVQKHILANEGYLPEEIAEMGEGSIRTNKSWICDRKNWGLIFLITSGTREEYVLLNFPNPDLLPKTKQKICFLWQKFYVQEVIDLEKLCKEKGEEPIQKFGVLGKKRAKTFNDPFLLLNDKPGFSGFKEKFLRTGLTNISKNYPPEPTFLNTLLEISREKPFYVLSQPKA